MTLDAARRLAQIQARHRANDLVALAQARSPFLAQHYRGWRPGVDDWRALPTTDKSLLMANFDGWMTDRAVTLDGVRAFIADTSRIGDDYLGRYAVWCSSGTSGHPGIFLHDGGALATYAVLTSLRLDGQFLMQCLLPAFTAGLPWGGARCALVAALDGHYAGVSFWQRQTRLSWPLRPCGPVPRGDQSDRVDRIGLSPWLGPRSLVLSVTEPMDALCARLDAFAPSFLASYPSMLVELAARQRQGRLHIAPRALWAGGEAFSGPERAFCEQAFGAATANDYGCSEALSIAVECRCGRLHVHDDWVLLEPIDAQGRPVPPGQRSDSVLLTNLANRIAPIIRYNLGDSVLAHPDPCRCGNPRPTIAVQGRCDDLLQLRDAQGAEVVLSPLALTTVLEEQAGLYQFQLLQTGPRRLALRLAAAERAGHPGAEERALQVLQRYLRERGLHGVTMRAEPQAPQPEPHSGKLRRVVRTDGAAHPERAP